MPRRKQQKSPAEERLEKNRLAIWEARRILGGSPLGRLFSAVAVEECMGMDSDPKWACVDPARGVIRVNPRVRQVGDPDHLAAAIGHMLRDGRDEVEDPRPDHRPGDEGARAPRAEGPAEVDLDATTVHDEKRSRHAL